MKKDKALSKRVRQRQRFDEIERQLHNILFSGSHLTCAGTKYGLLADDMCRELIALAAAGRRECK